MRALLSYLCICCSRRLLGRKFWERGDVWRWCFIYDETRARLLWTATFPVAVGAIIVSLFTSPAWLHQQAWDIWAEVKLNVKMTCCSIWRVTSVEIQLKDTHTHTTEIWATKWLLLARFPRSPRGFQCLCKYIWTGSPTLVWPNLNEKNERGAFTCRRWQHVRPRTYRLWLLSLTFTTRPPFLSRSSLLHTLFCSLFFLSLSPPLSSLPWLLN